MSLLFISFIAGVLTVLAPCILPVLPVVIGRSLTTAEEKDVDGNIVKKRNTPLIVCVSLAVSIFLFTILLKVSTLFIDIPQDFWKYLSATILIIFGILTLFGEVWAVFMNKLGLNTKSNILFSKGYKEKSLKGDIIMGAALGPVFSTCSPTYFIILATVLPASLGKGIVYLLAYILGLCLVLFGISVIGQKFVNKLNILANPNGWFKRIMGIIFILVGIFIATGYDKKFQTYILDQGFFDVTKIEQSLLENMENKKEDSKKESNEEISDSDIKKLLYKGGPAPEISSPDGFINTNNLPITVREHIGKKIVLLDIWTYSCINCKRTLPYLNDWYAKYKDQGLEIIGLHTPEFIFEHKIENVAKAVKDENILFPVVLDNDYSTWNELGNQYWPRKYIIDLEGNIVYDHIGEGAYKETEKVIQHLLNIKNIETSKGKEVIYKDIKTHETYFGFSRNEYIKNTLGKIGLHDLKIQNNSLSLGGTWNIEEEYAEVAGDKGEIYFPFQARNMYLVFSSPFPQKVKITDEFNNTKEILIDKETLYEVYSSPDSKKTFIKVELPKGVKVFAATFG